MTTLRVLEIFDSLQGEGFWTGIPMTFVRLAGCNAPASGLHCTRWCDTRESWDPNAGEDMAVGDILSRVRFARLCLTGGEPLLQLEGVCGLVRAAHGRGLRVHVETNGTVGPPTGDGVDFDWAAVSPKPPDYVIVSGWEGRVDELKLIADESLEAATAERVAASHPEAMVCIQPCDETGRRAPARQSPEEAALGGLALPAGVLPAQASIQRAVRLVMEHPEWRLLLQTHKLLGMS